MTERPAAPRRSNVLGLSDVLALVGFVALVVGIGLVAAPAWSLIVGGTLLLGVGLIAAWRRGS